MGKLAAVVLLLIAIVPTAFCKWYDGHATFYGDKTGLKDGHNGMAGACGYRDFEMSSNYGIHTTALSAALFNQGATCGACYEIRCFNSKWCKPGAGSVVVTATNFCPSNAPGTPGWCNPPFKHFDMSRPAWETIGIYSGGIIPVKYRRVYCQKPGGIHFYMQGNPYFNLVLVSNVGGAGDVTAVSIKGQNTNWVPMKRNWGQNWQSNVRLVGQSLSFRVTTSDGRTTVMYNVTPEHWQFGQRFDGKLNFLPG